MFKILQPQACLPFLQFLTLIFLFYVPVYDSGVGLARDVRVHV